MNSHLDMLAKFRSAQPTQAVPGFKELTEHLNERIMSVGETAFEEFAYLHRIAARIWGPERTAHFAIVLRKTRVAPKAPKTCRWKAVGTALDRLPTDWQGPLRSIAERSEAGKIAPGLTLWSTDYLHAVTTALRRYLEYAHTHGAPKVPSGWVLHRYAVWLTDPANHEGGVSVRAAADYLARSRGGLAVVEPAAVSPAREFVCRFWREKGKAGGTPTKTGDQLVGAVAIYDLGFRLMREAQDAPMRGLRSATDFRNGLMLALGIALPQRARAISALQFGATLWVQEPDFLRVRIPATMLKLPEDRKSGDPFDMRWRNDRLVTALEIYHRAFRPLFDGGDCLFPSMHSPGQPISAAQIGRLCGDITEREFGVRISIHRFRDNVATEASENLTGGRLATAALLDHSDIGTGDHYDHSDGKNAVAEFGSFIDSRRTKPADLAL